MNRRRALAFALAVVASSRLRAQASGKPVRVGVLSSTSPETRSTFWDEFRNEMVRLGWVEERDLVYVYRYTRGDRTRMGISGMDRRVAIGVGWKPHRHFGAGKSGADHGRRSLDRSRLILSGLCV